MKNQDDYLWDPSREPEAELRELERQLGSARWSGDLPPLSKLEGRSGPRPLHFTLIGVAVLAATAAAVAVMFNSLWLQPGDRAPTVGYRLELLAGALQVDGRSTGPETALGLGERIQIGPAGRAVLHIGGLGNLTLEAGTELAILDPHAADTRASERWAAPVESLLSLERGAFEAVIYGSPGAFQVLTPAGLSVDLGCVYRAEVEADGSTKLAVLTGRVAFEGAGRRVTVPTGAAIHARPGERPSTPLFDDADPEFAALVARLDRGEDLPVDEVARLVAAARPRDGLTLVHLLGEPSAGPRLYEHLSAERSPPSGVTREGCLAGDPDMLEAWVQRL